MRRSAVFGFVLGSLFLIVTNWFWVIKYTKLKDNEVVKHYDFRVSEHFINNDGQKQCEAAINNADSVCTNASVYVKKNKHVWYSGNKSTFSLLNITSALKDAAIFVKLREKVDLVIGIPTVERKNQNYLFQTIDSLIKEASTNEKNRVVLIILLADPDENVRLRRAQSLKDKYEESIESGFLHIVQIVPRVYPTLEVERRTFGDPEKRVQWRMKQVVDFAFMFSYAAKLGNYFMILEDDITASPHYVTAILDFVALQKHDWVSLTFTEFLIIGRLLKTSDLERLVVLLMLFYVEKPVDLLICQFIDLMVPDKKGVTRRIPGTFQHVGLHSSLDGKIQKLKDKSFSELSRQFDVKNPPADIITSIFAYEDFYPELAYSSAYGFFWGCSPKKNDTFDIILRNPVPIKRIYIKTGAKEHPNDILVNGELRVGKKFINLNSENHINCQEFVALSSFQNGILDYNFKDTTEYQCLQIHILSPQKQWLVISEIAIFT